MTEEKQAGCVYILTNPSFPEYVKIGYADNLQKRLKELNRSECIPYAFRVYAVYYVNESLQDVALHNMIDSINPTLRTIDTFDGKKRKKEFYAMSADDAYNILNKSKSISEEAAKRILLKGNATVTLEAAKVFADAGICLIGNESQTVGPEDGPMAVHKVLLGAEVVLLEGVRLSHVPEGVYLLNAAPINIAGAEGAPCRAVLIGK